MSISYESAGVNIAAGGEAVNRIKKSVKQTYSKNVLTNLGSFGSAFSLKETLNKYKDPILVQSTDGVGTKLIVAKMADKFEGIGKDVVSNNVNDMLCMGATPITFLDYIGCSSLSPEQMEIIVKGIAKECQKYEISLVGGEMAEMPGVYVDGEVDVVGFVTGVVDKDKIITGEEIQENDVLIGLTSSGLHTNGYSLARKVIFEIGGYKIDDKPEALSGKTVAESMLEPHRNYVEPIKLLQENNIQIKGLSHITGGGFVENIPRILPDNLDAQIQKNSYPTLPIFDLIKQTAQIKEREMYRTFNMGIGMVIVANSDDAQKILGLINQLPEQKAYQIGQVVKGEKQVKLV